MNTHASHDESVRLLNLATRASVLTAGCLVLLKIGAWLMTGSVSLLASLIDSIMDGLASLINLFAVRYALMPADKEHPFGHGKAEFLAGLGQSVLIAGSAAFLFFQAINRLQAPQPVDQPVVGAVVSVLAILATLLLLSIQWKTIKRTGSVAIRADSLHYVGDLFTNIAVVVAMGASFYGWYYVDPVLAIVIGMVILYSAIQIGYEAVQLLMDRELPREMQEQIREIAMAHPEVLGVHELRTRQSGRVLFMQLHLEMAGDLPLSVAHAIGDEVEAEIEHAFPLADVLIHHDPAPSEARQSNQQAGQ
ncbi:MAG: cation diffusion facilitator family transporter [Gammaproteobacteria bacterium]|nr:cation diffusion facilitator family transporter [Gammaproteobacteria bacterium]